MYTFHPGTTVQSDKNDMIEDNISIGRFASPSLDEVKHSRTHG